jgi:hypothetical protein
MKPVPVVRSREKLSFGLTLAMWLFIGSFLVVLVSVPIRSFHLLPPDVISLAVLVAFFACIGSLTSLLVMERLAAVLRRLFVMAVLPPLFILNFLKRTHSHEH